MGEIVKRRVYVDLQVPLEIGKDKLYVAAPNEELEEKDLLHAGTTINEQSSD